MCFPKYTVYTIDWEQKYTRYNWLMENAFNFPIFSIKKPVESGFNYNDSWKKVCWSIDISEKKILTIFDFWFKNWWALSLNILIVISIYLFPIYYFTLFAWRQDDNIIVRFFAIICFLLFWSTPYFFFYLRL